MSEAALLLVDDDAPILRMLERTLTAEGYEVVAAADGGAALAAVERNLPAARCRDLELTRREAELLALLLRNARGVVTRELALEEVWGGEGEATMNAVDRYVAYLRRKLGEPPLIHTVRGIGFRLDRE